MKEQDLKGIWQSSENQEHVQFDKTKLISVLESDFSKFKRSIKYRDWREIGIAILMMPLFAFMAFKIPFLLSKLGSVIIVGWCFLLIFRILRAKKKVELVPTESYLTYLKQSKDYLLAQKALLETVLFWYILPVITGVLLFFMGFDLGLGQRIFYISITFGVGIATYLLNKYAVKKGILPRLKKVDEIIKALNE